MTTRVATLSAGADGDGDVEPEAGGKIEGHHHANGNGGRSFT